jgi:hypothetical protein
MPKKKPRGQPKAFVEPARALGCDEHEGAFDRKLKRIAMAPKPIIHKSDCAVHDAPAYKPGRCTCGAEAKARR